MPTILNDERDPMKRDLGKKIMWMKKNRPQELAEFLTSLSEREAEEIMYDQDIWLRDNQWVDLSSSTPIHFMSLGRGAGKRACVETPVITPDRGFVRLGDLQVGDQVYDERGKPCNILGVHDSMPEKAYRFTFSDGSEIDCCADHLWTTWEHRDRKQYLRMEENKNAFTMPENWPQWSHEGTLKKTEPFGPKVRTAQEIVENFHHSTRKDTNHSIPVTEPLEMPHVDLPVDPYIMGYWIGDGARNTSTFAVHETDQPHFIEMAEKAGYEIGANNNDAVISLLNFLPLLRESGSLETKKINPIYLYNSYENRIEFLRGLMDSDGHISPDRSMCEFCSKTEEHAEAVFFLAASLGYKPKIITGRAMFNGHDYGTKYRVFWNPSPHANPFKIERKASRVKYPKTQGFRNCHRMISSYEEIDPKPMRCLTVDSPNHLFLIGKSLIPTHNTLTGAATVKRAIERHGIEDITVIGSTSRDIRSTIAPAIIGCYAPSDPNRPYFSPASAEIIFPDKGVKIGTLSAESGPDKIRGGNNGLIWMDEFAFYGTNEEILDQALLTLRLEPSIMLITTTPKATPKMIDLYERGNDPEDTMVKIYSGSTYENAEFLSELFMETVVKKYEGTRMGDTELEGKLILTNDAALWQYHTIIDNTITLKDIPRLVHICIGVDPAVLHKGSRSKHSRTPDDTGITVSGIDEDGIIYTLEGVSASFSVEGWVTKVAQYFDKWSSIAKTNIMMEINQHGEDMINLAFDSVNRRDLRSYMSAKYATESKLQRAAPYALLAEQGKLKYVESDYMRQLASELTTYDGTGASPNCLDSAVWSWRGLVPPRKTVTVGREFLI